MGVYNGRITDRDGTVLVNLGTSTVRLIEYAPQPAEPEPERGQPAPWGVSVLAVNRPNVVESARVAVLGDNTTARTTERGVATAFARAAHHQEHPEDAAGPIYWEFELFPGDGYWRTEIKSGSVELGERALGVFWTGQAIELRLLFERQPFFEGPQTAVALSNGNGTNVTSGITVRNHEDGGAGDDTFVSIGTSGVTGALPTPAEIRIESLSAPPKRAYDLFVGVHSWGGVSAFAPALEAESAETLTGFSTQSGASYSNGSARTFTWSGTAETLLARFTLSSALLSACRGGWFRVFARIPSVPVQTIILRLRTQLFSVTTLAEGDPVQLQPGLELQDIGAFQLPPYLGGETSLAGLSFLLSGEAPGGTGSLPLDFMYLMPLQSYRHYRPRGYGLAQNTAVRELPDGTIRSEGWAGGNIGHYVGDGSPLMLWPGQAQRLYFLQRCDDGTAPIDRELRVQLWHRPRRVLL
jgi:hypothetical protein